MNRYIAKAIVGANYWHQRITNPKTTVYDGCDPRDFIAQKMLKTPKGKLKPYKNLFEQTNQEPILQEESGCTAYGTTMMKRIQDSMEHGRLIPHEGAYLWEKQGRPAKGDLLTRSLQVCVDNPFCTEGRYYAMLGYAKVRSRNDGSEECIKYMKKWLARDYPIKTGFIIKSGRFVVGDKIYTTNMSAAKRTGVLFLDSGKTAGGHDDTIVGYDDEGKLFGVPGFILYTPWGKWGVHNNGLLLLPYNQVKYLMSCYISYDSIDVK